MECTGLITNSAAWWTSLLAANSETVIASAARIKSTAWFFTGVLLLPIQWLHKLSASVVRWTRWTVYLLLQMLNLRESTRRCCFKDWSRLDELLRFAGGNWCFKDLMNWAPKDQAVLRRCVFVCPIYSVASVVDLRSKVGSWYLRRCGVQTRKSRMDSEVDSEVAPFS